MSHDVVKNWMRNRETIEFLGIWESLHNPSFKQVEFDLFRTEAGGKVLLNENDVEVVSLLQKMSNTRPKAITLDVEMKDYSLLVA